MFDCVSVRRTTHQKYRVEPGESEIDLSPGASIDLLLWSGVVKMSGSSPGISANAELRAEGGSIARYDVDLYEIDDNWRLSLDRVD